MLLVKIFKDTENQKKETESQASLCLAAHTLPLLPGWCLLPRMALRAPAFPDCVSVCTACEISHGCDLPSTKNYF